MSVLFKQIQDELMAKPRHWLVTGAAGFIGSNLVERLLMLDQYVTGLDDFSTGYKHNLEAIAECVGAARWPRFKLVTGSVADAKVCRDGLQGVDLVLHQAALGSVPRSINDPCASNDANVTGFVNLLWAAKEVGIKRVVYASSSSVYGDSPKLPKVEAETGKLLSPYAVSKMVDELYAGVFADLYGLELLGLRYFNVFGPRQDPKGAYAAVVPLWIDRLINGERAVVNGDGTTTRDFCYIENVIQANILAAVSENVNALNQVYNIAVGERTSLNDLYRIICTMIEKHFNLKAPSQPQYAPFRTGDIKDSLADITKAQHLFGYEPSHSLASGMDSYIKWYHEQLRFRED